MMLQALRTYTRGRVGPTPLALPPLLLALAVLPGANQAAAQMPEIQVYHSLDPEGADPRSDTCPPGCDCTGGGGETATVGFDGLTAWQIVTEPIGALSICENDEDPDYEVIVLPDADQFGTSSPNVISSCREIEEDPYYDCENGELFINFAPLVNNLTFVVVGDDYAATAARVNVFEEGWLDSPEGTVDIETDGDPNTTHLVDLSEFNNVSRIHIYDILDYHGIGFDDFSFETAGQADCVIQGGAGEEVNVWIDGGLTPSNIGSGEIVCYKGESAGSGHELCGADILLRLEGPPAGFFSNFNPDENMDTLVHSPPCVSFDEGGLCEGLPAGTRELRMNFRRGDAAPSVGPRRVGTLVVNSTDASEENPTSVVVSGFGAAGASLQFRPIAEGGAQIVARGPQTVYVPEPGEMMLLASCLAGLALLYRLRGRP
jgi:hypothetical protein